MHVQMYVSRRKRDVLHGHQRVQMYVASDACWLVANAPCFEVIVLSIWMDFSGLKSIQIDAGDAEAARGLVSHTYRCTCQATRFSSSPMLEPTPVLNDWLFQ